MFCHTTYKTFVLHIVEVIGLKLMGDRGRHRLVGMKETQIKSLIQRSTVHGQHQMSIFVDELVYELESKKNAH